MKYLGFTVLNSWACEPASLLALASWAPMSAAEDTWPFQTVLMDKQQALLYSFPVSGLHLLVIKLSSCLYDHGQVTNPFWAPMLPIFNKHNSGSLSINHHSKNLWLRVLSKLCLWENLTWTDPRLSLTIIIIWYYHAFHCRNTNVWLPWTSQQSRDFRENTVYVHHFLSYIRMSLNSENLLTPRVSLKGFSPHKLDICFIESLYLECSLPPICLENIQNISNVIMNEWIKEEINFFLNQEFGASLRGW